MLVSFVYYGGGYGCMGSQVQINQGYWWLHSLSNDSALCDKHVYIKQHGETADINQEIVTSFLHKHPILMTLYLVYKQST